jgi:hypothetical protein
MAVSELQGNRNPLIDHADWASRIDVLAGFGYRALACVEGTRGRPMSLGRLLTSAGQWLT